MARIEKGFQLEDRIGGLGLSCTSDGVFLAGVPLLRKTVAGLTPRPMDELAVLMKRAYGHDVHATRSYPGLDVIAQALNRGDVGRAMVAAIHLRLPGLDKNSAAHMAFADEALNKFDPSEPRDEQGRWTTDGGSSANTSATSMNPILISNPSGPGWHTPIESRAVIMGLSRKCVNDANEPRYFEKTQACATVQEQCGWLAQINEKYPLRDDACIWPNGAAAVMKRGIMVPFRFGHSF